MTSLMPLKDTTKSILLNEAVKKKKEKITAIFFVNICGIATDDAPVVVGKKKGLARLIEDDTITSANSDKISWHQASRKCMCKSFKNGCHADLQSCEFHKAQETESSPVLGVP